MTKDLSGFGIWVVLLGLALTSSVLAAILGKLTERSGLHLDRVREGYAEAAKALMAWSQFPYRIERRVDDKDETRAELSKLGSDIMERLGYYSGWVTAENVVMGEFYLTLVARLRTEVGEHARWAWQQPPRESAARMNTRADLPTLSATAPSGWAYVQAFSTAFSYRFGWRRYLLTSAGLKRRLTKRGLWEPRHDGLPRFPQSSRAGEKPQSSPASATSTARDTADGL